VTVKVIYRFIWDVNFRRKCARKSLGNVVILTVSGDGKQRHRVEDGWDTLLFGRLELLLVISVF
jgi:hypothetical protein